MLTSYKHFIFTQDPDELVKFYTEALGFLIVKKLEYELDYGYTLELPDSKQQIWLAKHSEVTGKNKDKYRTILNLYSTSVQADYDRAISYKGTTEIQKPRPMSDIVPEETRYVSTLLDPEDNCIQIMGPL